IKAFTPASGKGANLPYATLSRLIRPTKPGSTVGWIRRLRRIRQKVPTCLMRRWRVLSGLQDRADG
ncbi:hypothetical protein, partial [Escherichia sp. E2562]|uniref:hypothetical protein n=1 Tax=Escherichia sp. E2562 TaxID=2041646 RepID=UPI00197AF7D6